MNMYRFTKDRLISQGYKTDEVDLLAKDISISTEIDKAMFKFFDDAANKLPWPQDRDFGALALQRWAALANEVVAKQMIYSAIERATYCARCSTSGGEGLARAEHIRELKRELKKFN
jgi:hypothetical protein